MAKIKSRIYEHLYRNLYANIVNRKFSCDSYDYLLLHFTFKKKNIIKYNSMPNFRIFTLNFMWTINTSEQQKLNARQTNNSILDFWKTWQTARVIHTCNFGYGAFKFSFIVYFTLTHSIISQNYKTKIIISHNIRMWIFNSFKRFLTLVQFADLK